MDASSAFYDSLAPDYHLLFSDWPYAVSQQAKTLNKLLQTEVGVRSLEIHDCACGIGTQALGLARIGHKVSATDISPAAVGRAREEAASLGLQITLNVADMRTTNWGPQGAFDVVLACDNAVPHLLTAAEVLAAARNMYRWLRPGGIMLISTRDYDLALETKPRTTPLRFIEDTAGQRALFQVWEWDEDKYDVHQFILLRLEDGWQPKIFQATYRAWRRAALTEIYQQAGFRDLRWRMPAETEYYQPILTGRH